MFSEAWHRVAGQQAQLHPSVEVVRQRYRGEPWYVLREPFSNSFFRLSPAAYFFVSRLRHGRTIEEVWRECLELYLDEAPGQQEVIRLLAQLNQGNLIQSDLTPDAEMMRHRREKSRNKELRGKVMNFLFLKFGLLDPTPFLDRTLPVFRPLFNRVGFGAWCLLMVIAIKFLFENWEAAWDRTEGILAPSNLFLLYVCGIGAKFFHELGHGLVCRALGGEVRTLGVMLLILTPLPYIDATSSWSFRNKWHRIFVSAAGMLFEFALAAVAVIVWANTGSGTLNATAYNLMVIASVTTFIFNINPLLRFDGYYIFSDLLEIPNLYQRSTRQLKYLLEKYAFKCRIAAPVAHSTYEGNWLAVYGISAGIYRIFLLGSIALIVAELFFGLGIILAAIASFVWLVLPVGKFFRYLFTDPILETCRPRALGIIFTTLTVLIILIAVLPFPLHARAEGIVEAQRFSRVFSPTGGRLEEIFLAPGQLAKSGQPLVRFSDRSLDWKIEQVQADLRAGQATLKNLAFQERVRLKSVQLKLQSSTERLRYLEEEKKRLILRAPFDGYWSAPGVNDQVGTWLNKGEPLGVFIDPSAFRFAAVVQQKQAADVFFQSIRGATVRLRGRSDKKIQTSNLRRIPAEQTRLPTAALGWRSGGEIEVLSDDPHGTASKEPFFLLYADLDSEARSLYAHHRRGQIRFHVGYEPLFFQGWRALRQLLQKRLKF
ncbi:MAG: biotin/lipoyl-binding protein [Verrucomicrobiota bacterium]